MVFYEITQWLSFDKPEGAMTVRYEGSLQVVTKQFKTFFVPYDYTF